jgi:hypothetical protein
MEGVWIMSIKQDGTRVRTAHDLEQKYNLAGMKRAFEQSENVITRVNQILEDFVNTIIGKLDSFEGLEDGYVETYFYSGTPTLENSPTVDWTDKYEYHINDVYYDKESGYVYIFKAMENGYGWEQSKDTDLIKSMALANATNDTKDGSRKIYTSKPKPPYSNGDLWVDEGNIYICQISKPETEVYEEHDFIEASKYEGDTHAIKIGTELVVLKGTVLKVIEDSDFLRVEIEDLDQETKSSIELIKNMLSTIIVDGNGQSMMTQTPDGWKFEMKSILETLNSNSTDIEDIAKDLEGTSAEVENINGAVIELLEKTTYVNIGSWDGKACIELGAKDSKYKVIITNEEMLFTEDSDTPAYIKDGVMKMEKAYVEEELQISTMAWVRRANGHLSFLPKGVN